MRTIWVISDTHFVHENILGFKREDGTPLRPFSSVEEMNETMIERWNDRVKPGDIVYHLGDVTFGSKDAFKRLWPRLNGRKRLIVGNHDDIKWLSSGGFFQKVMLWRKFDNWLLTHVPIHESGLWTKRHEMEGKRILNVHGHIHGNKSPTEHHRCVCVEHTNYYPVALEEIE